MLSIKGILVLRPPRALRQVYHHTSAGAAEDRAAGEHLGAERGGLAIAPQTGGSLELCQEIEQQQHAAKRGFRGEKRFQAETVGAQVVLQFGDAVFHVGAPIVTAPDLRRSRRLAGDEDTKCIAGHVNQFAPHTGAGFPHLLADDHETPLRVPAVELETELAHGVVVVQAGPRLHALRGSLDPLGHAGNYNVGDLALFQKAQQQTVKEAG